MSFPHIRHSSPSRSGRRYSWLPKGIPDTQLCPSLNRRHVYHNGPRPLPVLLWIATVLVTLALTSGPVSVAQAVSFDCTAARSTAERLICTTPELGRLDVRLSQAYARAVQETPWRKALREAQRVWLTGPRDAAAALGGAPALVAAYQSRIAVLEAELTRAGNPQVIEPAEASAHGDTCLLPLPSDGISAEPPACRVRETGSLPALAGQALTYAVYDYGHNSSGGSAGTGVLVFGPGSTPDRLRLLVADLHAEARCEKPQVLAPPSPEGSGRALLHVPCTHAGTQAANDETVYGWTNGSWRELDVRSWRREFLARVPRDRHVTRGVYPDYSTMTVRSPLWGPNDPDCCASYGTMEADLGWRGDRLAVRGVRIIPSPGRKTTSSNIPRAASAN
jgi:uncharacterized protein YecT (DUF1311 family)